MYNQLQCNCKFSFFLIQIIFWNYQQIPSMFYNLMRDNKNLRAEQLQQIVSAHFHNKPRSKYTLNNHSTNIITHKPIQNYSTIFHNPQQPPQLFSARKSIPKNTEILRERSEMIVHPSKISRDVPNWFKGQTYKYFSRQDYNDIRLKAHELTLQHPRNVIGIEEDHRSYATTPRSQSSNRSSQPNVFYQGGGNRDYRQPRSFSRRPQREITGKIGFTDMRDFQLPKIPIKIGHPQLVNTHKPL